MHVTRDELDRFHDFALSLVTQSETDLTWVELFELWCQESPSSAEYRENVAAIRQAIEAMQAGRVRPFSDFDSDFRARHGLPTGA